MGSPINSPVVNSYQKISDIVQPSPSLVFTFVDELSDTINDASFALQWEYNVVRRYFQWLINLGMHSLPATK